MPPGDRDRTAISPLSAGRVRPAPVFCVLPGVCSAPAQLVPANVPDDIGWIPSTCLSDVLICLFTKQLFPISWSAADTAVPVPAVPAPPARQQQVPQRLYGSHPAEPPEPIGRASTAPLHPQSTVPLELPPPALPGRDAAPAPAAGPEAAGTHELKSSQRLDGDRKSGRSEPVRLVPVPRLQGKDCWLN